MPLIKIKTLKKYKVIINCRKNKKLYNIKNVNSVHYLAWKSAVVKIMKTNEFNQK